MPTLAQMIKDFRWRQRVAARLRALFKREDKKLPNRSPADTDSNP